MSWLPCGDAWLSLTKQCPMPVSSKEKPLLPTNQKHSPVCVTATTSLCSNDADWSDPNIDLLLVFQIGAPPNGSLWASLSFQLTCSSCCCAYYSFRERSVFRWPSCRRKISEILLQSTPRQMQQWEGFSVKVTFTSLHFLFSFIVQVLVLICLEE